MEELFEEIQTFLNDQHEASTETKTYEQLLEEFYQVPSYVERFKRGEASE